MQLRALAVLGMIALPLAACSGNNQQSQATASPEAAATTVASPASVATTAAVAAPAAVATATPTPNPTAVVKFTDISGIFAEPAIKQEATLGVFETTSGKFNPYNTVPRSEYVRWLVLANNIYFKGQPDKQIRLAEANSSQSFVDVPKSNPDFKYIQGMANSGFVIGIDKNHFAPDRPLTREEMIAILMSRDANSSPLPKAGPPSTWNYAAGGGTLSVDFTDRDKVSKPYWGAFQLNNGWGNSYALQEVKRIYGNTKIFDPLKPVTRADVAVALQVIDQKNSASLLGM
ncbi:MAG TPA: S-layer homology domain-containing protein [Candidatus Rubrimentiphilum sp.]|nr:S-layer homology domain-containing protein [Candidatus Rubrimentiphilum sp.]